MDNYFVTALYENEKNKKFFKEAKWDMRILDMSQTTPVDKCIWEMINDEEAKVIFDVRRINNAVASVLMARYMKQAERTFVLLSSEQEQKYIWGYGAGAYDLENDVDNKKILRLWRDIEFFFERKDRKKTNEPVREFLKNYWSEKEFTEIFNERYDIDFERVERLENNKGESLTERLKECAVQEDSEAFKLELRNISGNPNLDFGDYIVIGNLCGHMNLKLHRVSIMEQANARWKNTIPKLYFGLIDAYIDSPNIEYREKALEMVEKYFEIERPNTGELKIGTSRKNCVIAEDYLKSLFNAYISLEKYDELMKLMEYENYFIERTEDEELRSLFLRNKAICKKEEGYNTEALKLFKTLYKNEPTENTVNLITNTYEDIHDYVMAAKLQLALVLGNYGSLDALLRLANIMMNHSLFFGDDGEWRKESDINDKTNRQVVPLLMFVFAFEKNQNKQEVIFDIYRVIEQREDVDAMDFLIENKNRLAYIWSDFRKIAENQKYDMGLVEYIQQEYERIQIENKNIEEIIEEIIEDK